MAPEVGSTLGPFRIIELLGKGGMASVYKAYQAKLERHVALKVLPQEFIHDDTFAKRFEREARVVAKLEHPKIVPIYDYGIDEGIPWMSMRLLPVGSLEDLLKQGRLDWRRVVAILAQVAEALDYAHAAGVVHRDVKPGNILLDDEERAYIGDFGIARLVEATSDNLTGTGALSGTAEYMAPEQTRSGTVDRRADIYSLGIVAYQMLTGAVPFTGTTIDVMIKHRSEPVPIPPEARVPVWLLQPVLKALAKDREDRWNSAGAFTAALTRGLDKLLGSATIPLANGTPEVQPAGESDATQAATVAIQKPGDESSGHVRWPVPQLTWALALGVLVAAIAYFIPRGGDPITPNRTAADQATIASVSRPALPPPGPEEQGARVDTQDGSPDANRKAAETSLSEPPQEVPDPPAAVPPLPEESPAEESATTAPAAVTTPPVSVAAADSGRSFEPPPDTTPAQAEGTLLITVDAPGTISVDGISVG